MSWSSRARTGAVTPGGSVSKDGQALLMVGCDLAYQVDSFCGYWALET
jgi:hypothetical protein